MRIRKAVPEDVETCADIESETYSCCKREDLVYERNREVKDRDYIFLVAEEGGKVVGFVTARKQGWNMSLWLEELFVTKKFQREGVGTKLVDEVKKEAKKFKAIQIFLDAGTRRLYQPVFYMKNGFKLVGFIKNFYGTEKNPEDRDSQIMAYKV